VIDGEEADLLFKRREARRAMSSVAPVVEGMNSLFSEGGGLDRSTSSVSASLAVLRDEQKKSRKKHSQWLLPNRKMKRSQTHVGTARIPKEAEARRALIIIATMSGLELDDCICHRLFFGSFLICS
jgi:hypothetical protein